VVTFKIELDATKLKGDLKQLRERTPRINRRILSLICEATIASSNKDYLRGGKSELHWRTGNLARSESYTVSDFAAEIVAGAKYAAIHESGGTIVPRTKEWLMFEVNGHFVKTKKVVMPKRPFLGPALEDVFSSGQANKIADSTLQEEIDKITGGSR